MDFKTGYKIEDGVTQSMLSTFLNCRQRSKFYLDGWDADLPKHSASRGDLIHLALEKWYQKPHADVSKFLMDIERQWLKAQLKRGNRDEQSKQNALAELFAIFPNYMKKWAVSDLKRTWVELEAVFDVKFHGFRLRGKRDGLFDYKLRRGKHWLFETKTKAQIDEIGLMDQLAFDFQNLFYLTALEVAGTPAVGVVYNVIRSPNIRRGKNDDPEAFQKHIEAHIKKEGLDHYFKRYEVTYTDATIKRFKSDLRFKLEEFAAWVEGKRPTYRNESACIGRMKCPFLGACASGSMVGYISGRKLFRELEEEAK